MNWKAIVAALIVVVVLPSCRATPIYNVNNASVTAPSGGSYTRDEVKTAILRAGNDLGWEMTPAEPGHLIGTLNIRRHMAQVDIYYDRNSYSIKYKDSANLKYDGSNIHRNYNSWIKNLDEHIRRELTSMKLTLRGTLR
jgi:hypothetical protein